MTYQEFLESKILKIDDVGFKPKLLNPKLKDFQAYSVEMALRKGRFALFQECGLGKTFQQLEWAYQTTKRENKRSLILCPLAVAEQTKMEAKKFGVDISKVDIVNYDQLHKINPSDYCSVVLDESSILKNFEGKYRNALIKAFKKTKYKLCCTATPSPNDPMELGNHSEFLGYMKRSEVLAMYFVHDGGQTSKWRLKGHAINDFYRMVSKWAIMMTNPADLGFDSTGYDLSPLIYHEHKIITEKKDNGLLFNDVAVSATNYNQELRETYDHRIEKTADIANENNDQFIVWVKHNRESEEVAKSISGAVEVKGNDDPEYKKEKLLGFAKNEFRVLVTKAKIAQFGLNYQNCHNQIFASLDFSFESTYQGIRRSHRFGQTDPVNIHFVVTDTMGNVMKSIKDKQELFDDMKKNMVKNQIIIAA